VSQIIERNGQLFTQRGRALGYVDEIHAGTNGKTKLGRSWLPARKKRTHRELDLVRILHAIERNVLDVMVRKPALRLVLNRCRSTGFLSHTTMELLGVYGRDLTAQENKLAAEIDALRSAIFVHATVAQDGRGTCFATKVDEHGLKMSSPIGGMKPSYYPTTSQADVPLIESKGL
jgi:hypothetical protein